MRSWGEEEEFASQALKLDKPQEAVEDTKMTRIHSKYLKLDKPSDETVIKNILCLPQII